MKKIQLKIFVKSKLNSLITLIIKILVNCISFNAINFKINLESKKVNPTNNIYPINILFFLIGLQKIILTVLNSNLKKKLLNFSI